LLNNSAKLSRRQQDSNIPATGKKTALQLVHTGVDNPENPPTCICCGPWPPVLMPGSGFFFPQIPLTA
jgi:hypothetical protein